MLMIPCDGPTADTIAAAKDAQARERRIVEVETGGFFHGDKLVIPHKLTPDLIDALAARIADAITRAASRH